MVKIDKSVLKKLFVLAAGCILFAWLVLDTARATTMFSTVWNLISPFVVGAGIAFVFNVPMRAIERQLADIRRAGFRRLLSIVLTILCLTGMGGAILGLTGPIIAVLALTSGFTAFGALAQWCSYL